MSTIDKYLNKKYVLQKSENMDDYFKAIGLNFALRKLIQTMTPVIELTKSGDVYTYTSETLMTKMTVSFKPGEEVNKKLPDGQIAKSVSTINGCTMLEIISDNEGGTTTVERIFSEDGVEAITKYKDVIATSYYKPK